MIVLINEKIQVTCIGHDEETLPILQDSLLMVSCCALRAEMDKKEQEALIDVLELLRSLLPKSGQMSLSPPNHSQ
jgi:hypothetical protein